MITGLNQKFGWLVRIVAVLRYWTKGTVLDQGYGTGAVSEVRVCCLGVSNEVSRSLEGGGSCDQSVGGLYKKGQWKGKGE